MKFLSIAWLALACAGSSCASAPRWIALPAFFSKAEPAPWPAVLEKDPFPSPISETSEMVQAQATAFLDFTRGKDLARCQPFLDRIAGMGASALPTLHKAAEDLDPDLRFKATMLLGEIADPRSAASLAARLGDSSEEVAMAAARALRHLGERWVAPRLFESILGKTRHPSTKARVEAAAAAVELGFPQAIPFLLTVLKENTRLAEPQGGWKDWEWDDRWAWQKWVASECLEKISGLRTGFDANQGVPQMEDSVRPWMEWWEREGNRLEISAAARNDVRLRKIASHLQDFAESSDASLASAAQRILESVSIP